ncbi:MAG: 2-phosphosulfolactate phosphatase [Armatimonadota bacterium]
MPEEAWFGQEKYRCRLEWGIRGAHAAARRGDVLVVVDVLSFSTAVATAVEKGAEIYPCGKHDDAVAIAKQWEAVTAVRREEVPDRGRYSLSPETFLAASPGERIVLPSPNGAACSRYVSDAPQLLVGALVNAASVADAAARAAIEAQAAITVLACGERWQYLQEEGDLRFALEDYIGAGAILAHLPPSLTRSPEAMIAQAGFEAAADRLPEVLRECGSGIELRGRGYPGDVEHAARLSVYTAVPVLQDALCFAKWADEK